MKKYFLNEDELRAIVLFCGGIINRNNHNNTSEIIKTYKSTVLMDLLEKRPDLTKDNEQFKTSLLCLQNPIQSFITIFQNKISIEDFSKQIFQNSYAYNGEQKNRSNLFIHLQNKYPSFINIMHNYLAINKNTSDKTLYQTYFKFLKDKKIDKDTLKFDEIIENIKSFSSNDDDSLKRKINAYLTVCPKDEKTYDLIFEDIKEIIQKNGTIKNFLEEKLELFPKSVLDKYRTQKESTILFSEKELFNYYFNLNIQYIVERAKVPVKKAESFSQQLHSAITSFFYDKFPSAEVKSLYRDPFVSANFPTEKMKNEAKDFCHSVVKNIDTIIEKVGFDDTFHNQKSKMEEFFQKIYFAHNLEKELLENKEQAPKRLKI